MRQSVVALTAVARPPSRVDAVAELLRQTPAVKVRLCSIVAPHNTSAQFNHSVRIALVTPSVGPSSMPNQQQHLGSNSSNSGNINMPVSSSVTCRSAEQQLICPWLGGRRPNCRFALERKLSLMFLVNPHAGLEGFQR